MTLKQIATIPRIIGIILILFAAYLLKFSPQNTIQAGLIAIVGIILAVTKNDSAKKHFKGFIDTFRLKSEFAKIMAYDAGFWVLVALLAFGFISVMKGPYAQLQGIQLTQESITSGALEQYNGIIQSFLTTAVIALIVLWLLIVTAYSLSRGFIWLTLLEKPARASARADQPTRKSALPLHKPFFVRFGILNLVWCIAWLVLGILVYRSLIASAAPIFFIALILLYLHITTVVHYAYTKHRAFGKSIAEGFGTGIGKFGSFVQPYCYIFIIQIILTNLLKLAQGGLILTATFIAYFVFMAWYRIYMRNILRRIV
jgi:hypothetical protein